ncbi:MAG: hypothetical protein ACEPOW_13605 [Bacteroidales bacterium]
MKQFLKTFKVLLCTLLFIFSFAGKNYAQSSLENQGVYRIRIEVYNHQIDGFLCYQKLESSRARVLITTFSGPSLLDMEMDSAQYKVKFAAKKLNKRIVLKLLHKDFLCILSPLFFSDKNNTSDTVRLFPISRKKEVQIFYNPQGQVIQTNYQKKGKVLIEANLDYKNQKYPQIITLHHKKFDMTLSLERFENIDER